VNCDDFRNIAPIVLYRDVDPSARVGGEEHLRTCASCRTSFSKLKERLCSEIHDALDDYLDGAMDVDERATFDAHLAVCPECRDYLSSYERTVRLSRASHRVDDAASEPPPELLAAVLAARRKRSSGGGTT
jgi:predicted anti-sigma-YlaC factor YlaD